MSKHLGNRLGAIRENIDGTYGLTFHKGYRTYRYSFDIRLQAMVKHEQLRIMYKLNNTSLFPIKLTIPDWYNTLHKQ